MWEKMTIPRKGILNIHRRFSLGLSRTNGCRVGAKGEPPRVRRSPEMLRLCIHWNLISPGSQKNHSKSIKTRIQLPKLTRSMYHECSLFWTEKMVQTQFVMIGLITRSRSDLFIPFWRTASVTSQCDFPLSKETVLVVEIRRFTPITHSQALARNSDKGRRHYCVKNAMLCNATIAGTPRK